MKVTIFCNYGCLTAEKRNVFTAFNPAETAVTIDKLIVEIPDELIQGFDVVDSPFIGEDEVHCLPLSESLQGNEHPELYYVDKDAKEHRVKLNILEGSYSR